ncbi:ATP-binding protein [Blastococcus sp. PRF04-17]|uniref:ATP-binding protein n=1 Tax=Blastococcus sp. PRF04-17 TaxID=2933797 RepID=UPI001FF2C184|nr:ATP-binding protein [Blastococcus sp. PRF04-17]UOY00888.1 ATP-binding protein [Blastococcus sp. PRF04-17]
MCTRNASIDLPPIPPSIPVARHVVRELLRAWDAPHDHEDAALLVTELVANVVDHVQGEANLSLELAMADAWLRIAVVDGSAVRPVVQELTEHRPRGRGLQMVRAIADRWGVEDHRGGKRVWFELAPPLG